MRKALLLAAILLCLCLPVWSEAQSCDGCGIGYHPPSVSPSGGTFTGPILLPNGSNAAPSVASAALPTNGIYFGTNTVNTAISGVQKLQFDLLGITVLGNTANSGLYLFNDVQKLYFGSSSDTVLARDAANTLALRNSTAAQGFNIYNTSTDASNYERGRIAWSGNQFEIKTEAAGTGIARPLLISPAGPFYVNANLTPYSGDLYSVGTSTIPWIQANISRSIQGSKTFALTDGAAAAAFVRIAVPQTVDSNFAGGDVIWTATAKDATPHVQALSGRLKFSAVNNAGTEVCAVDPTAAVTAPNANSSGTLSCTMSCASNAADTVDLMATCDTSLGTPTGLTLYYRLDMPKIQTITPQ